MMISVTQLVLLLVAVLSVAFGEEKLAAPHTTTTTVKTNAQSSATTTKTTDIHEQRHSLGMKIDPTKRTATAQMAALHKARNIAPRHGVQDPKVMNQHYQPQLNLLHDNHPVDASIMPIAAQEEEVRRNLRTYTRIPTPYEYKYAAGGQFTEVNLFYDYYCSQPLYSVGFVNNRCNTVYNFPAQRMMMSTMTASNGGTNFFVPAFTAFNDSSCVLPVDSHPVDDMTGIGAECTFNFHFGYYSNAKVRNLVPTQPIYGQNALLLRSHKTAWQCHNKKATDNVEYKVLYTNHCFYDMYSQMYMKVDSCDKNTHTANVRIFSHFLCLDSSEIYSFSPSNTDDCSYSDSMISLARGFFSYTCI